MTTHTMPPVARTYDDPRQLHLLFGLVDPHLAVADRFLSVAKDVRFHVGVCMPATEHRYVDGPSGIAARPQAYLLHRSGPACDLPRVGLTELAQELGTCMA